MADVGGLVRFKNDPEVQRIVSNASEDFQATYQRRIRAIEDRVCKENGVRDIMDLKVNTPIEGSAREWLHNLGMEIQRQERLIKHGERARASA